MVGRDGERSYGELPGAYREVLELFADASAAPLSVHNITRAGEAVGVLSARAPATGEAV